MSYAVASALQAAVYARLSADFAVNTLVGNAIYDALPSGNVPSLYVSLGPEIAVAAGDKSGDGALHKFVVSVVSDGAGFSPAKDLAVAVNDALHHAGLTLTRGRLVAMFFDRAVAKRSGDGTLRTIDLTFRARVEDV